MQRCVGGGQAVRVENSLLNLGDWGPPFRLVGAEANMKGQGSCGFLMKLMETNHKRRERK